MTSIKDPLDAPLNRHERRMQQKILRDRKWGPILRADLGGPPNAIMIPIPNTVDEEEGHMVNEVANEIRNEERQRDWRAVVIAEFSEQAKENVRTLVFALLRDPQFKAHIQALIREAAADVAKEILAEDGSELETRVKALIRERWDQEVEAAAHAYLQARLTELKRKL